MEDFRDHQIYRSDKGLRVALGEFVGAFIRPFSGDLADKVADAFAGSSSKDKSSVLRIFMYDDVFCLLSFTFRERISHSMDLRDFLHLFGLQVFKIFGIFE